MTREEAIEIIRKEYACVDADCDIERSCGKCELHMPSKEPILKAYEMAIKALSQEPTIGQLFSCEEVEELRSKIWKQVEQEPCYKCVYSTKDGYCQYDDIAETIPTEQEPSRDMEEIAEIMKCDVDAETKCKMISSILTAKPHYFEKQDPCETCGYAEGSPFCLQYCPYDAEKKKEQEPCCKDKLIDLANAIESDDSGYWTNKRISSALRNISSVMYNPTPHESKTVLYSGDGYADGYMVYDMAECPNCGYEYEDGDKDWGLPFCPNCGQSLKWI